MPRHALSGSVTDTIRDSLSTVSPFQISGWLAPRGAGVRPKGNAMDVPNVSSTLTPYIIRIYRYG